MIFKELHWHVNAHGAHVHHTISTF